MEGTHCWNHCHQHWIPRQAHWRNLFPPCHLSQSSFPIFAAGDGEDGAVAYKALSRSLAVVIFGSEKPSCFSYFPPCAKECITRHLLDSAALILSWSRGRQPRRSFPVLGAYLGHKVSRVHYVYTLMGEEMQDKQNFTLGSSVCMSVMLGSKKSCKRYATKCDAQSLRNEDKQIIKCSVLKANPKVWQIQPNLSPIATDIRFHFSFEKF